LLRSSLAVGWNIMRKPAAVACLFVLALFAFLAGRYSVISRHESRPHSRRILYYVDPMHPAYTSDKPGIAPDCGMPLEPVYEGEDPSAKLQLPPGAVSIQPDKLQLIGVRVEAVVKNSGSRLIRTTGRVEADDNRVHRLMAATDGYVLTLENNPAGAIVKKDELLATFYSKEFRNAQQAYLGSLVSGERIRRFNEGDEPNHPSDANLRINEEQLRALGMGDPQIKDLAKNRQTDRNIRVVSPVDGVVLSRSISPDFRFEKGAEFYRIADLNKVWIIADIFGGELPGLRPGTRVRVTVRELGKTLYATVTRNPPLFDAASRTLKLRLEADNPGFLLRPDMFVDLEFRTRVPAGISVPQEAVLDSGLQKIVYVETSQDVFEPRPVEIGSAYGDRITIRRGLADGERLVTSGNFLIDSESRLRSATLLSSGVTHDSKQQSTQNSQVAMTMRDPVCGMPLHAGKARSHVEKYHGETYVFCSDKCQKKFQQNPEKYIDEKLGSTALPQHEIEAWR
jgi:membrane fusion protein, copper/silver efflux system